MLLALALMLLLLTPRQAPVAVCWRAARRTTATRNALRDGRVDARPRDTRRASCALADSRVSTAATPGLSRRRVRISIGTQPIGMVVIVTDPWLFSQFCSNLLIQHGAARPGPGRGIAKAAVSLLLPSHRATVIAVPSNWTSVLF